MASYFLSLVALAAYVSAAPQAGQTYTISPAAHPELCVVPSGDWNGARLIITDCDNSDEIAWSFDGQSLKNSATNRCVDVLDGGHWNGNGLQAWDCFEHNTNQRFGTAGGSIQWQDTGMCLDLTDGQSTDGTTLQLWQCFDGNTNQQWTFDEVEEVDDCDDTPTTTASAALTTVSSAAPSSSASQGSDDGEDCDEDGDDSDDEDCDAEGASSSAPSASATAAPSASSTIGGGLWVGESITASASASWNNTSAAYPSASASDSWNASSSAYPAATASVSASDSWESVSASASASATSSASTPVVTSGNGNADYSGYQQTSGTKIVDASGNTVQWKGTNLGGWLVWEDWMCGITDNSGSADRFPQTTLENRFGEDQTRELMKVWQDNWLVESDFDNLAAMGFNVLRLPFSYRNFVRSDGSYITDSNGQLDYSRLEWAIAQAKKRGMYVIPTYHIWEGQEQRYSTISEDSSEGQQQRNRCGDLWTMIAQHFAGETAIAAFDAINEPTGSANNNLQRDLYNAIRKGDPKRIIVMESISAAPDSDWTNVVYSMHEYLMMGENDFGYNKYMFSQGPQASTDAYTAVGVPTYIGEFMASGETLDYMLDQMNNMAVGWSSWAYKTQNMDRWGLYNFGGDMRVDVSADSFDSIKNVWSNMGPIYKSRVADQYAAAAGGNAPSRRSLPAEQVVEVAATLAAPAAAAVPANESLPERRTSTASSALKRSTPHAGRSRRGVVGLLHGKW